MPEPVGPIYASSMHRRDRGWRMRRRHRARVRALMWGVALTAVAVALAAHFA